MIVTYFYIVAALFVLYMAIRWAFISACRLPLIPLEGGRFTRFIWRYTSFGYLAPIEFDGKAIDTAEISGRIRQIREELAEGKASPHHHSDFKRARLVETKREQISRLAYFKNLPPVAEPPETEQGMGCVSI